MSKVRISTTVDADLLGQARACLAGAKDAVVMERALGALIAQHREAEFDRRIDVGYGQVEYERPDAWGDLHTFLEAANVKQHAAESR